MHTLKTVRVPADHTNPSGGELTLSCVRLPSPHPERTPVVFLAGGPGDSGIGWLRHEPFLRVFERVAATRDVVLLDQRGCGQSEQDTHCAPPDFRDGWLCDETMAFAMMSDQAVHVLKAKPLVPAWYTPLQSARDLAYVADALNTQQIHLWGYSYGTHLTQVALKILPDRIERAVLCGFEGPNHTLKLPSRIQAQCERLSALAARQGVSPDLLELMRQVHENLDTRPVGLKLADGTPCRVGRFGLQWLVSSWVGVSNRFTHLPALYLALAHGETTLLERAVQGFAKMLTQRPAVFYLKDAASGATADRLARIEQEAPGCILGNAANFPFPDIRAAWRQTDLGDNFRTPLVSKHPLSVLTGSLDGFTPTENATESLGTLPNAHHRVIENAAHNDLLSCPEAVTDLIRFFADGTAPSGGYSVSEPRLEGGQAQRPESEGLKD